MCLQRVLFMPMWSEPAILQEHLVHVKRLRGCEQQQPYTNNVYPDWLKDGNKKAFPDCQKAVRAFQKRQHGMSCGWGAVGGGRRARWEPTRMTEGDKLIPWTCPGDSCVVTPHVHLGVWG